MLVNFGAKSVRVAIPTKAMKRFDLGQAVRLSG